jgi:uncharacterized SAM-binding protein YcdF (DUF218 family)
VEWLITNAVAALLLPPGIVLVILLVTALQAWRRPLQAWKPAVLACVVLYALSTPFLAGLLLYLLEPAPRDPIADKSGQAIVVLGGGIYFSAPEYGGDTVKTSTLARLRYAAHLHRALGKPLLVSGGAPERNPTAEAELMKQALQRDFQVPVQWVENGSRNTFENARSSFQALGAAGIHRIYLVTHAWHMPRARIAFEHHGFSVIPASTGYATRFELTVLDFLPDARAMHESSIFFHETIGVCWYYVRALLGR